MSATMERSMNIVIEKCSPGVQQRIRERLDRAAELRCEEHGQPPVGVIIHGRENGWFDARWTTCCEPLEQQARAIVKERL
jgi:hypothetical protein